VRNTNAIGYEIDAAKPLNMGGIALSISDFGIVHCWRGVWIEQLQLAATGRRPAAHTATAARTAAARTTAARTTCNICLGHSLDSYGYYQPDSAVLRFGAEHQQHCGYLDGDGTAR
jgi:hypothetical protein